MKNKICQIVDSSGSLPRDFIENYDIIEVPFYFKFKDTDYYRENIDYDTDNFFRHMKKYPEDIPKTSAPNPHDWLDVFEREYKDGFRDFIVTTISSKLSNSFQAASVAKNQFKDAHEDIKIEVIDSNTCATGKGAFEIWISRMIRSGRKYEDIVKKTYKIIPHINSLFVVNSLKYMNAGGRIGGATAFIGKVMNIKPLAEFVDGEVEVIKPSIGRKKSLRAMIDVALSRIDDINDTIITIQNAMSKRDADYMEKYLKRKTSEKVEVFSSNLGITVGAHSGPGAIGIGFVEKV